MRNFSEGLHYARVRVGVLVSVKMGGLDSGIPNFLNLSQEFLFDMFQTNQTATYSGDERCKRFRQAPLRIGQGSDFIGGRNGLSSHKDEVASDAQSWIGASPLHSVFESQTIGHQSRAGKNSFLIRANDRFVDAAGHAEIVCVED